MSNDLPFIRGVIRESLKEARAEGLPAHLHRTRAMFFALKAMMLLCKDMPLSTNVEIVGDISDEAKHTVRFMMEPSFNEAVQVLSDMVDEESAKA